MNDLDFLYLLDEYPNQFSITDFKEFYNANRRACSLVGAIYLERYLFSFLDHEIKISDNWNIELVKEYFMNFADKNLQNPSNSLFSKAMLTSQNPENAAKNFLIQLAPDFLIESRCNV